MQVQGRTFVITGAGSGMGQELALQLLAKGGSVAAVDIRQPGLDETVSRAGVAAQRLSTHIADVSDKKAVHALLDEVLARHGHVDGLFNNAGIIQPFQRIDQLEDEVIERIININFYGPLTMTRAFLPVLRQRPEAHIVNTSSMGGFLPVPGQAIYGASKAAVKLMTEALYAELLETDIRVSVVFPGAVATNIAANSGVEVPAGSEGEASASTTSAADAAAAIIRGMERDAYHILVGADARMMDRLTRLMPKRAVKIIQRQMKALLPDEDLAEV